MRPRIQTPILSDEGWLTPDSDVICSMAIAPDGRSIVSGSADGRIRLWDAHTGHPLCARVKGHRKAVEYLAFTSDGTMIASGSLDNTLRMWDANGMKPLGPPAPLIRSRWNVTLVAISPDGRKLACLASPYAIDILDVHKREASGPRLADHTAAINCFAFSSHNDMLISGSDDGELRIWSLLAHEVLSASLEAHESAVTSVAISSDGKILASGALDHSIRIWDAQTHQPRGNSLEGHTGSVYSIAFFPKGTWIISGSADRTVRVWDVATGAIVCEPLQGHREAITSVAVAADGLTIVSQSRDGTIRLWDAPIKMTFRATHEIRNDMSIYDTSLLSWPYQLQLGPRWSSYIEDGYIMNAQDEIILWVPYHTRHRLMTPRTRLILGAEAIYLDFSRFKYGTSWTECYTPDQDDQSDTVPSEIEGLPVYGPRHFIP